MPSESVAKNEKRTPDRRRSFPEKRVPDLAPFLEVGVEPCHSLIRVACLFEALSCPVILSLQARVKQHAAVRLSPHADGSFWRG